MTKPLRIQLSRKRGFRLQEVSLALNGLSAINVTRQGAHSGMWGNWAAKAPRSHERPASRRRLPILGHPRSERSMEGPRPDQPSRPQSCLRVPARLPLPRRRAPGTGERMSDDSTEDDDIDTPVTRAVYIVRKINSRTLVGIFLLPEDDERALFHSIDEATDPAWCEYAVLPEIGLLWDGDRGPIFPDCLNAIDDGDSEGLAPSPRPSDLTRDLFLQISDWRPVNKGWVYFIRAGDFIKIGYALDVRTRLNALQVGTPEKLEIIWQEPGEKRHEVKYHQQFAAQRERGEWFRYEGALKEFLESLT